MAPKKKIDKIAKPARPKEKVSKKKVEKEKPTVKSPDIVKYTFPPLKHLTSVVPDPTINPSKCKSKEEKAILLYNRKIELANEVAHFQLAKPGDVKKPSVAEKAATQIIRPKKRKLSNSTDTVKVVRFQLPQPEPSVPGKAATRKRGRPKKHKPSDTTNTAKGVQAQFVKPGRNFIEPSVPEKATAPKRGRLNEQKPNDTTKATEVSDVTDSTVSPNEYKSNAEKAIQLDNCEQRQIELSNEVAQTQFVKPGDFIEPSVPEKATAPKRRKPNKQKPSHTTNANKVAQVQLERGIRELEVVKEKRIIKKTYKARKAACATKKIKTDSPAKNLTKQRKNIKLKTVEDSKSEIPKKNKKIYQTKKRKLSKRQVTTLENVQSTDNHDSPSTLDQIMKSNLINNEMLTEGPGLSVSPSPVVFHEISPTNSCGGFSWTKDISESSTTTCLTVSSNDFVRIGKKIPVLKLANIANTLMEFVDNDDKSSDRSCSESSANNIKYPSEHSSAFSEKCDSWSLGQSTSMTSHANSNNIIYAHENTSKSSVVNDNIIIIDKLTSDKLTSKVKLLDLENIAWFGRKNKNTHGYEKIQEEMLILKVENNIFMECRKCCKMLFGNNYTESCGSDNCPANNINEQIRDKVTADNMIEETHDEDTDSTHIGDMNLGNVLHESNVADNLKDNEPRYSNVQKNISDDDNRLQSLVQNENFENDSCNLENFNNIDTQRDSNEDDDALSLYAESITGIETSRFSSSIASKHLGTEKYVPQPLKLDFFKRPVSYVPTKITNSSDEKNIGNSKTNAVCEKHNADSTSIYKEFEETATNPALHLENGENDPVNESSGTVTSPTSPVSSPAPFSQQCRGLMSSYYTNCSFAKSSVFRGVCFFNLIKRCINVSCPFPHLPLQAIQVKSRLMRLSRDAFIQEYMLLRLHPNLKLEYGLYFMEECYNRDLTRILVEMAKDFIETTREHLPDLILLKVNVVEHALLHLNDVDLSVCEDLLMLSTCTTEFVQRNQNNTLLCDVFMKTIAESQNFSRFKPVFTKLTVLMVNKNRTFSMDVAALILERMCILPWDIPHAQALLNIIKNTDENIFGNSMIEMLERKIQSLDKNLYLEFLTLKKKVQKNQPAHGGHTPAPIINHNVEQICLVQADRGQRYTSPDSTNLDNLNKAVLARSDEPQGLPVFRPPNQSINTSNTPIMTDARAVNYQPPPKIPKFKSWRGRGCFNNMYQMRPARPLQRPMRGMLPPPRFMVAREFRQGNTGLQQRLVVCRQPLRRNDYSHRS